MSWGLIKRKPLKCAVLMSLAQCYCHPWKRCWFTIISFQDHFRWKYNLYTGFLSHSSHVCHLENVKCTWLLSLLLICSISEIRRLKKKTVSSMNTVNRMVLLMLAAETLVLSFGGQKCLWPMINEQVPRVKTKIEQILNITRVYGVSTIQPECFCYPRHYLTIQGRPLA